MVLPAGDKSLLTVVCQQDILHLKNTKYKNDVISMFSKIQMFILYIFYNNPPHFLSLLP